WRLREARQRRISGQGFLGKARSLGGRRPRKLHEGGAQGGAPRLACAPPPRPFLGSEETPPTPATKKPPPLTFQHSTTRTPAHDRSAQTRAVERRPDATTPRPVPDPGSSGPGDGPGSAPRSPWA